MSTVKLCKGIAWLRKPVTFDERLLEARLTFLFHRPWFWLPLFMILGVTLLVPFMEIIPTSGSIASAVIALFAAGLLTRDGGLVGMSFLLPLTIPLRVVLRLQRLTPATEDLHAHHDRPHSPGSVL